MKKTIYDQKKCTINDFFYPKCDNILPPPLVYINLSEELEVASPPCSLAIPQSSPQPSTRDPMPEIEADIDIDNVDAPDMSLDVNPDKNPEVNTPSLHPWGTPPEGDAISRPADPRSSVPRPPRTQVAL